MQINLYFFKQIGFLGWSYVDFVLFKQRVNKIGARGTLTGLARTDPFTANQSYPDIKVNKVIDNDVKICVTYR